MKIHPTAIIGDKVKFTGPDITVGPYSCLEGEIELHENVVIGPYCYLNGSAGKIELQARVKLLSHVNIDGNTTIGHDSVVYAYAALGHAPQDLKYSGEPSIVRIGAHNTIREYVTIQRGTQSGAMATIIGDHCLFMGGVHIAHDCKIGNHVILANYATLGGHVEIDDYAIIGGVSAIHQKVRIGKHAIIGGMSGVEHDVIPYGAVKGERAKLTGLNLIGMQRRGFSNNDISILRKAYDILFNSDYTIAHNLERASESFADQKEVKHIIDFITDKKAERAMCLPQKK